MKFRKDNRYSYGQDFSFFNGVPSGIDFKLEKVGDNLFRATAKGYGILSDDHKDYGNGALYLYPNSSRNLKKRLEDMNG